MALLFIDSFDHYDSSHILAKWTAGSLVAGVLVGQGRCGTNCVQLQSSMSLSKGLPFGTAIGTMGFAMRVSPSSLGGIVCPIAAFAGSPQSSGAALSHLSLELASADGSLRVVRGSASVNPILGATGPDLIHRDHWSFVEWQATIHPTAGAVTVRVNNAVVLTLSGINTVADYGTPLPADLRSVALNCTSGFLWMADDVYVLDSTGPAPNNTFLGDCRVEYLRPRADSSPQQWTPVGGTLTHWRNVDDNATPDDDGTYVEANVAGLTDQNVYMPTGLPAGPIFGAQLNLLAKKSEAGPRVIAPVVNGTPTAPNYAPSYETYQYFSTLYPTNPATGLPWTIAEINAVQLGVTVVS